MASQQLTARQVEQAKPRTKEYSLCDGAGLYLRIRPSGTKTWIYHYKNRSKKSVWLSLGEHHSTLAPSETRRFNLPDRATLGLANARVIAGHWKSMRNKNVDPVEELNRERVEQEQTRLAEKAKRLQEKSVREVANVFYRRHIEKTFKRPEQFKDLLDREILSKIGDLPIKSITRLVLTEQVIAPILERDARRRANQVLAAVKKIFSFARDAGYLEQSPAEGLSRKSAGGREKPRERALSFDEIKVFLRALYSPNFFAAPETTAALKIVTLTGQRIGETTRMRWVDIDVPPLSVARRFRVRG